MMATPDAPLLPLRERNHNQRWCIHLPRRDRSLASFLVKVSDVLVNGVLSLNVFAATYFLKWGTFTVGDDRLPVCFETNVYWKAFVFGLPFALYLLTLWINGVAKSAELSLQGLTTVSIWVLLEMVWCILLGALLTHCVSGANYIGISCVATVMICLLMLMWGNTFNHPRCFRWCCWNFCCCGLDPEIAAVEARDQVIAAEALAIQVARAQAAFSAQVRCQELAVAVREGLDVAREDKERAEAVFNTKAHEATLTQKTQQNAIDELAAKILTRHNAAQDLEEMKAWASSIREQAWDAGQANTKLEQVAKVAEDRARNVHTAAEKGVSDARANCKNAFNANNTAQNACNDANHEAARLTGVYQRKLSEVTNAEKKAMDACATAQETYKEAAAAQSVALLVG